MKKSIDCIYCEGIANLQKTDSVLEFRKEKFEVVEHYYKCSKCETEFTNSDIDTITVLQAHNQYREKYNIPFPEEIKEIREKYGVSAAKMSEILGFGTNGYANYENGEMPTVAYGKLIRLVGDPQNFKQFVEESQINEKVKNEICKKANDFLVKKPEIQNIDFYIHPNKYKGFKKTNIEKLIRVLCYYIIHSKPVFNDRLKLNKLLFYTDFLHYKLHAHSLTGVSYRAVKYGPVPSNYDNIFTYLISCGYIDQLWVEDEKRGGKEIFETSQITDEEDFSSVELCTIQEITKQFNEVSSWDIVDISHKEDAWIESNEEKLIIDYQKYAFNLKAF